MQKNYTRSQLKSFLRNNQKEATEEAIDFLEGMSRISQEKCIKTWHDWLKIAQFGGDQQKQTFEFNLSNLEQDFLLVAQIGGRVAVNNVESEKTMSLEEIKEEVNYPHLNEVGA